MHACLPALLPATLFSLLLALTPVAVAGTDFTPRSLEREEDGLTRTVTYLATPTGKRTFISPPGGWTLTGNPAALMLYPPDRSNGIITLRGSPFAVDPPAFDAKGLELYRRRVLAELPPEAAGSQIVEERSDAAAAFGWKTYEFVLAWESGGQRWQQSVIFITPGATESAMVATAVGRRVDHAALREGLLRLLSSWCRESAG